jgi:hypothetical protein
VKSKKTELDFGHVHLFPGVDINNLSGDIAKSVQVNTDQTIADECYRMAQKGTKPYRLKVTVELSEV